MEQRQDETKKCETEGNAVNETDKDVKIKQAKS